MDSTLHFGYTGLYLPSSGRPIHMATLGERGPSSGSILCVSPYLLHWANRIPALALFTLMWVLFATLG